MRKAFAVIMIFVTLLAFPGCSYKVKDYKVQNEENAKAIYTCSSDNMYGLEKAVIFEDGMVLVFDKEASDSSKRVKFDKCKKGGGFYGYPVNLYSNGRVLYVESYFEETSGKYVATAFVDTEREGTDFTLTEMQVFHKNIEINDGNLILSYKVYGTVSDGYELITQQYDPESGEWGKLEKEFVSCGPYESEDQ